MIERAKAKMISLYLDDPCGNFSHPWYRIQEWMSHNYMSVRITEGIPSQIFIYLNDQIFFYWSRYKLFQIDKTMYAQLERLYLHERYLTADLLKDFIVKEKNYRFILRKNTLKHIGNDESGNHYSFKTINLKNDRTRHINLLTTLFTISEERLIEYFNTPINKEGYAFVMVDNQTNRPIALGLGGIDHIIKEGVIDYIEILSNDPNHVMTLQIRLLYELSMRLIQQADFVTISMDSGKRTDSLLALGYKEGGAWLRLHRRHDASLID